MKESKKVRVYYLHGILNTALMSYETLMRLIDADYESVRHFQIMTELVDASVLVGGKI